MSALAGIRILDLSRVLAGPSCTQILADLGAEVWKIEPFWGDETRGWGDSYFRSVNRGKKSLAVNFKVPEGAQLIRELASRADVLVENFKVGDLSRVGLDYASLEQDFPRLVYVSITGYGQTGPCAAEPGYDAALQARTGIMSLTGPADGVPFKVGVAWIDILTGLHACVGVIAALRERDVSGRGQHLDMSLFEVGLASLANVAQSYLDGGGEPHRYGNHHPQIVPYGTFACLDGLLMVAVGNDRQFARFAEVLGQPDWANDPRFATNMARVEHRADLIAKIESVMLAESRLAWSNALKMAEVPCAPVQSVPEAFADPQSAARGVLGRAEDGLYVRSPHSHWSRTPAGDSSSPPGVGQHTGEILTTVLGWDSSHVAELERSGAIGLGSPNETG